MTSQKRWQVAQQYERTYWERRATQIATGASAQLGWYRWRAERLQERLRELGFTLGSDGATRIIEVGSGPVGVAAFMPGLERVLVDPLEAFYSANEVLRQVRPVDATYRQGQGEQLPAETGRFDLAIIENCIDHVQDPDAVIRELLRVLRPGGILYLTVNCRTRPGYVVHRILSSLRLDPGHPHTFTPRKLRRFLERHGLKVHSLEVDSYMDAKRKDLESKHRKSRMKAYLGISEYLASAVAQSTRESRG